MSYHKLMMENNTMYTKKVFDNVADRKLSKGQPKILEYLYENDGAVQKDIAKSCFIEQATVTSILARMEKNELIIRKVDPDNRRFQFVYLTEKGKETQRNCQDVICEIEKECFAGFSDEEKEQAKVLFERMYNNLNREDENINV